MNGKIRYSGTEKIERKIFEELAEKIETRLDMIESELKDSVSQEIRDELQTETIPYDRLRLIEQRIHEISTTQDGIVREIVDIKTTMAAFLKESDKRHSGYEKQSPKNYEPAIPQNDGKNLLNPNKNAPAPFESPFSAYTPYPTATDRISAAPPGFGNPDLPGPATPIAPVTFQSRKTDGWEYQEYVPAHKKSNVEPEKFVPAKTIPAGNDPFYFADSKEEILDVFALKEVPEQSASSVSSASSAPFTPFASPVSREVSSFENIPLTIQKVKPPEQEIPDRSEYIIGNNKKVIYTDNETEDYNSGCEYIIAEKDMGSRRLGGRRGNKPAPSFKEKVISRDEDDTDIITYE